METDLKYNPPNHPKMSFLTKWTFTIILRKKERKETKKEKETKNKDTQEKERKKKKEMKKTKERKMMKKKKVMKRRRRKRRRTHLDTPKKEAAYHRSNC